MNATTIGLALALALLPGTGTCAQWQWSVGTGVRQVRMVEHDPQDRQLVREQGLLPGVQAVATYQSSDWRLSVAGDVYQRGIAYRGTRQAGSGFASNTDTTQQRIGLAASRPVSERISLIGNLEWDRWQRNIQGRGATLGLNERYSSWRLLVGAQTRLLSHPVAKLDGSALLVLAQPERLWVQFGGQVYDDANLKTRSARGLRLVLRLQPASNPHLAVLAEWDTLGIARSDEATLFINGLAVGTVAQPQHTRQALGLSLRYAF